MAKVSLTLDKAACAQIAGNASWLATMRAGDRVAARARRYVGDMGLVNTGLSGSRSSNGAVS